MTDSTKSGGLRIIFSFFLGLMLTAFVGVGVYTFHPPPQQFDAQIRELQRREQAIWNSKPENELTTEDREQIQEIVRERNELVDASQEARKPWTRRTSVILIVIATLAMAVSLVRTDQLPVITNGLLLGGIFSMIYGVGWIVSADSSITRFVVMTFAFVITLGLGYVRFVRRSSTASAAAASGSEESEGLTDIERRVRALEERVDQAAAALGPKR